MDRKLDVRKIYESVKEKITFKPERLWSWAPAWETLQRRWRSQRSWIIRTFRVSQCLRFPGA